MNVSATSAAGASLPYFRWVRRALWASQLALVLWASLVLDIRLQLSWLLTFVVVGFVSDVVPAWWQRTVVTENRLLGVMLLDTALHTAVFALSGGPFNPFTTLYLVHVVLAALVLSRPKQWLVAATALLAFGSLFLVEKVAPASWQLPNHQELMRLHLTGMWVAFVIAAGFIVAFVQRVRSALADERRRSERHEKLAALTTLAAGAAHELSTPLGTIAVASHEMLRALDTLDVPTGLRDDAKLVREQVERCRVILQGMSARSGEIAAEAQSTFPVTAWLDDAVRGLKDEARVVRNSVSAEAVTGPRGALAQAVRSLVKNALEASSAPVTVESRIDSAFITIVVSDTGHGIAPNVVERMGEPFFTTKPAGAGMGLGVFLARTLAMQLGGTLDIASTEGAGTTVSFSLPRSRA